MLRDDDWHVHRSTRPQCVLFCLISLRLSVLNLPRYAVGFGLTFALGTAPLLITELAYPTQVRGSMCSAPPPNDIMLTLD